MAENWKPKQLDAIEYKDGNAIVSAAAGSGKTSVLVERIVRIITDEETRTPADTLAVATFTKKAAGEMRERLSSALTKKLEESPSLYLRQQLVALEDANITTISSLCLDTIRENAGLLDVTPGFAVLDESEVKLLKAEAMESTLADIFAYADSEENKLLINWYSDTADSKLSACIYELYNATRNIPDGKQWLAKQLEMYQNPKDVNNRFVSENSARVKELLQSAYEDMKSTLNLTVGNSNTENRQIFYDVLSQWVTIDDYTDSKNAETIIKLLSTDCKKLVSEKKEDYPIYKEYRQAASAAYKEAIAIVQLLLSCEQDMSLCAPVLKAAISAEERFEERFAKLKAEKNAVDFSDIELMALKLLRDENGEKSKIAQEISARLNYIIVDEFQDSNELQYEIFRLMSNGKNLYFVGDIKQAIYKFRGAEPRVFARLLKDDSFKTLELNENFRSNQHVVDAVNGVFEGLMTEELGDTDYNDSAKLVKGNEKLYNAETENEDNQAEFVVINAESADDISEARYVAQRIYDLVNKEKLMVTRKSGQREPCSYHDFAILMRSGVTVTGKEFAEELKKLGIPANMKKETNFTDRREIMLMIDLLSVIDNPYQNIPMANVLLSPLFGFSDAKLAQLCNMKNDGKRNEYIYDALLAQKETDEQCRNFCNELSDLRVYMANNSVEGLVRHILDDTRIIPYMAVSPNGDVKTANLRMLLQYVKLFSGSDSSLSDFIVYIRKMKSNKVDFAEADAANTLDDAVTIMSVHGSKGLEYPVVFVSRTNKGFNFRDGYPALVADANAGIGMNVIDRERMLNLNTIMHSTVQESKKNAVRSEELRLLYVALTRAREKLIVTGIRKPPPKNPSERDDGSWFDWLEKCSAVKSGIIKVTEYKSDDFAAVDEDEEKKVYAKADNALVAKIRENVSTSYKYEALTRIPAKVTVSEAGVEEFVPEENDKYTPIFVREPSFLDKTGAMTGKERGDAYHKALELISWEKANAAEQLKEFVDYGKLNEREYKCIKASDIQTFMESELGKRISASKTLKREFPLFTQIDLKALGYDFESDEKPYVQGIADMFFFEDDGIVLVDYKTNVNITEKALYKEYFKQLDIYAKAIAEMTGIKVKERWIWSFWLGKAVDMR